MKAISLWQPWASLMAAGYKRIETRSWRPASLHRGDIVAIHAAKHWTREERELITGDWLFFQPYLRLAEERGLWSLSKPPLGQVVAIARFKEAVPTDLVSSVEWRPLLEERDPDKAARIRYWLEVEERAFGNYGPDRWAWVFDAVRPIQPIDLAGQQGIFAWPTLNVPIDFLEERSYAPWAEEVLNGQAGQSELEAMPS